MISKDPASFSIWIGGGLLVGDQEFSGRIDGESFARELELLVAGEWRDLWIGRWMGQVGGLLRKDYF